MSIEELRERLQKAKEQAARVAKEDGNPYDVGRYDGLKEALELLDG